MTRILERARRLLGLAGAPAPATDARGWLRAGELAAEQGDDLEADRCFGHVDVLCDGSPGRLALRATARERRWNLAGALADLEASDTLGARPLRTARLLRQLGQWDEAQAVLLAVADRDGIAPARAALWQLHRLRGVPSPGLLTGDAPGVQLLRGVDAALDDDLDRAALAFTAARPELGRTTRRWAVALGLQAAGPAFASPDDWSAALEARLRGALDDAALLAQARRSPGRRTSAGRLHDAHVLLALCARGRPAEREHLRAAAGRGDMGELDDVWVHARARRLGLALEHRPPTVVPLVEAQLPASSST